MMKGGAMTDDAQTIREEILDLRKDMSAGQRELQVQVRGISEILARLTGEHAQRLSALEQSANENRSSHRAMEERLHRLDLRCASRHGGGDRPPEGTPQAWWERSVGRIMGGLVLSGAGVAVGVLVERALR